MSRIPIIGFVVLVGLLFAPAVFSDQFYPSLKIHYEMQVLDPAKHLVKISASFEGFVGSTTNFKFYPSYQADSFLEIKDLNAVDREGRRLAVTRRGNAYLISNGSTGEFEITYFLTMNQHQNYVFSKDLPGLET